MSLTNVESKVRRARRNARNSDEVEDLSSAVEDLAKAVEELIGEVKRLQAR